MTVRDANGLVMQASTNLQLPFPVQPLRSADTPGVAVGGEFNVYEWGCIQESSARFRDVFNSAGVPIDFRWNGPMPGRDFKQTGAPRTATTLPTSTTSTSPGTRATGLPARSLSTIPRTTTAPSPRRMRAMAMLTSNGSSSVVPGARLAQRRRLERGRPMGRCIRRPAHAQRVPYDAHRNNTAGTFSGVPLRGRRLEDPTSVGADGERSRPSGVSIVSMGPIRTGDFVWNFDDRFWGQGAVGPDIPASQTIGLWWLKSIV